MNFNFSKLFTLFLFSQGILLAHCQVPCGIYNDAARIVQLVEDFSTIQKSMGKIKELSEKKDALAMNQLTRWIMTKEEHASKIQSVVTDYFLTQRIKVKTEGPKYDLYVEQTLTLHQILVSAMKCKQTVDSKYVGDGLNLIENFIALYFDEHGKNHIKQMRK